MVQRSMAPDLSVLACFSPMQSKPSPATTARSVLKRSVNFQSVQIRHYERILSDHPSCSAGAPIGIGWKFFLDEHLTVEEFEESRRTRDRISALNKEQRHKILLEWGVKKNELAISVRKNLKVKHQRRRTVVNCTSRYDRWEEAVENASRKFKKRFQWISSEPTVELEEMKTSPSSISTSTIRIPEPISRVMLPPNFVKTTTFKEPSVSNAQKPVRPPASPYKTVLKQPDDSSRDSFPKTTLEVGIFDVSADSKSLSTKCYGREEDDDIISIFDDSSSSSTEYTDSDEED